MTLFCFLIMILILMVLFLLMLKNSYAESPYFSTQTIGDYRDDWNLIITNSTSSTCKNIPLNFSSDISSVTLLSNGSHLNTTIWLNGIFDNPVDYLRSDNITIDAITYSLFIDVHSFFNFGTVNKRADYEMDLSWDLKNKNWVKKIILVMPEALSENKLGFKILNQLNNFTNFYSESSNYVDLTLDLNSIGSPESYLVAAQKYVVLSMKNGQSCSLFDRSDGIQIPPPDIVLSTSHNKTELRPGEEREIEIQLKTPKSELYPMVKLSAKNQTNDLLLTFEPSIVQLNFGSGTSILHVRAKDTANSHFYTIPVIAELTANETNYKIPQQHNISYYPINSNISKKESDIIKQREITINVLPPITFEEKLLKFYNSFFTPINGIYGAISGILVIAIPWFIKRIRDKQKKIGDFK